MRNKHELTWQPQRTRNNPNAGRWRKMYQNRFYYFPGGHGRNDEQAYQEALEAWNDLKEKLDGVESSEQQLMNKALNWIINQYVAVNQELTETQVA